MEVVYIEIFDNVGLGKTGEVLQSNYKSELDNLRERILNAYNRVNINKNLDIKTFDNLIGYKDTKKRLALNWTNYGEYEPGMTKTFRNSKFPLKDNLKKYSTHSIAPHGSYQMDLMFDGPYCYLIVINVNTRYLRFQQTNINIDDDAMKSAPNVLKALDNIVNEIKTSGKDINYVSFDGEKAFSSALITNYFQNKHIQYKPVFQESFTQGLHYNDERHRAKHSSLAIVDRVIRTIRDLAFNIGQDEISPEILNNIVWSINNAPHKTLSKYAGQSVSPKKVDDDKDLEKFIIHRIAQENFNIMNQPTFNININQPVRVYNEKTPNIKRRSEIQPGNWKVVGRKGHLFVVSDGKAQQIKSRYQIDYI